MNSQPETRRNDVNLDIEHALTLWFPDGGWSVRGGASGMNNTTRYVSCNGSAYVLRIYETHRDADKAEYEHEILLALSSRALPFRIPIPVRSPDGSTILRTAEGKLIALFQYIEGTNPAFDSPARIRSFGQAVGQLSTHLASLRLESPPAYAPYYELDAAHPRCTPEAVAAFCNEPPAAFEPFADALRSLERELIDIRRQLPALRLLPHQLVHGDLNASNLLGAPDGTIAAILDFEFVTHDLRVMESAVALSDLLQPERSVAAMRESVWAFLEGFGSELRLTAAELDALPVLLKLRRLDVFLHFLGRYWDGVDEADVLQNQIHNALRVTVWLEQMKPALAEELIRHGESF
jgi:homoserine kinase type II